MQSGRGSILGALCQMYSAVPAAPVASSQVPGIGRGWAWMTHGEPPSLLEGHARYGIWQSGFPWAVIVEYPSNAPPCVVLAIGKSVTKRHTKNEEEREEEKRKVEEQDGTARTHIFTLQKKQ